MVHSVEGITAAGTERFEKAQSCLLPNENVHLACETQDGFLVLTNRRVVVLKEQKKSGFHIRCVIPYDCILRIEPKTSDRVEVSGISENREGCLLDDVTSFDVRAPKGGAGENKSDLFRHFQSTMKQAVDIVKEIKSSGVISSELPPQRDLSYLDKLPASLTRNAILDLNTVLRDRPIHDELVIEASKFLGDEPFLLEESLRDGSDHENGALFAAGTLGYFWIQGRKQGRFMSSVIVDTVEWENFHGLAHQWQHESGVMNAIYSLTKGGRETIVSYLWKPAHDADSMQYPWLLQPHNGPWILADIMYKYSGKPLPASWYPSLYARLARPPKPRFYF